MSGLDPKALYVVILEFEQVGDSRWKYADGAWKSGKAIIFPEAKRSVIWWRRSMDDNQNFPH